MARDKRIRLELSGIMNRTLILKITALCIGTVVSILLAEGFLRVQDFIQLDGFSESRIGNSVLHHGDDEFVDVTHGTDCKEITRILLLGDSWMEDPILSGTIGRELSLKTGQCLQAVNGGTSSYAPTIYLLKGRQAFQRYGKFDYVFINIDETDIGDEWLRYRVPLTRDMSGRIVAVPFEKDLQSLYIRNGKLWAQDSPVYLIRFLKFAFFYHVLYPSIEHFTVLPDHYDSLMKYVFSPEAATSYIAEKNYFYDRLIEMVSELSEIAGGVDSVYVTHHPHFRGLVDELEDGRLYLPIVSEAIARLGRETGARILDARNYVEEVHGNEFRVNTYKKDDPFSHLAGKGAERYGKWIAEQVIRQEGGMLN